MLDSYCWLPSRYDKIHEIIITTDYRPIPMAAWCKAWVCGRTIAEFVGSNSAGAWMSVFCECCLLSGRGLCVWLITSHEDSYRVWSWTLVNEETLAHYSCCAMVKKKSSRELLLNTVTVTFSHFDGISVTRNHIPTVGWDLLFRVLNV